MTKLVIVESPAKCKKIEGYLGTGYKCAASFGHIRDLDGGLKAVDIKNNFKTKFKILPQKMKYVKQLRALIKKSSEVILATDDDREGEAIAWHLCLVFKLPVRTTKRIIFHEITKSAIKNAIQNPTVIDLNKVYAQQARQILDIMVGFTISPILWKHVSRNTKSKLSAGRCQTPALRLIYENQKEIDKNPGEKVYETVGNFTKKNIDFKLNTHFKEEDETAEFLEESCEFNHTFRKTAEKIVSKKQPTPLTTSSLQQRASNELHFSPKQTMKLAQTLYENGYITYMRTDSTTYSKDFIKTAKSFIKEKYGNEYLLKEIDTLSLRKSKSPKGKSKKGKSKSDTAQEAHEAIRPTKIDRWDLPPSIDHRARKLYDLILKTTLESCMTPALYYSLTCYITAPNNNLYKHIAEQVKFPGWKIVRGYEKENEVFVYLKKLTDNKIVNYSKIYSKLTLKNLKTHFTEARLVQQLEKLGIGRPSTFSNIISKIQERSYVQKENIEGKTHSCIDFQLIGNELDEIEISRTFGSEKNKLVIKPVGIIVLEFLLKHFDSIFVYDYTKNMEDTLDLISKGREKKENICQSCYDELHTNSKNISDTHREIIQIDEFHTYMIAKHGPVIKFDDGENVSFKKIKTGITLQDIKSGLSIDEIVEAKKSYGTTLGQYKGKDVILKKGKFGLFLTWNEKNYSLQYLKKSEKNICLEDVIEILSGKKQSNPNILKVITEDLSIRKGKYGEYIFYKTDKMKKPRFLKLKNIEWKTIPNSALLTLIKKEYNI